MLGKLIKYDLLFGAKKYLMMGAILLALLLTIFLMSLIGNEVLIILTIILAVAATIAYFVMYLVISIQHLYQQLVKRESYLSYTLPVSTHELLLSKLLTITIWGFVLSAVIVVFWFTAVDRLLIWQLGNSLYQYISEEFFPMLMLTPSFAASFLFGCLSGIVYSMGFLAFCVSLVNIPWLKVRNLGIAAAVLLWIFGGQIIGFVQLLVSDRISNPWSSMFYATETEKWAAVQPQLVPILWSNAVFSLILGVGFYIAAVAILKRRRQI